MKIWFKPLTEDLLEWARLLHNDPEVLSMLTDPHEVTPEEQKAWFDSLQKGSSRKRWVVWEDNSPIGLIRLDSIDTYNRSICVGMDIEKNFRGKGLSQLAYKELLRELFQNLAINRVWLLVNEKNERAIHIYKKLGFKEEGRQREALFKNGKYLDYISMSILRREYDPSI